MTPLVVPFETLRPDECLEYLEQSTVGRVALSVDSLPTVLPVHFALFEGDVVFRSVPGAKLSAAIHSTIVAFEVDGFERDGSAGWSVVVQGQADEILDEQEAARIDLVLGDSWPVVPEIGRLVRIGMSRLSGRRFNQHAPEASGWWVAFIDEGYV